MKKYSSKGKYRLNLAGCRFHWLYVLERVPSLKPETTKAYWRVKCDCGNEKIMSTCLIKKSKSCGCYKKLHCGFKKGENHPNWVGGFHYKDGYKFILAKDHPNANAIGYVAEHTLIMSKHLNRPMKDKETIHHLNGIKDDNRLENLELWSHSHPTGQRIPDKIKWCIEFLTLYAPEIEIVKKF